MGLTSGEQVLTTHRAGSDVRYGRESSSRQVLEG